MTEREDDLRARVARLLAAEAPLMREAEQVAAQAAQADAPARELAQRLGAYLDALGMRGLGVAVCISRSGYSDPCKWVNVVQEEGPWQGPHGGHLSALSGYAAPLESFWVHQGAGDDAPGLHLSLRPISFEDAAAMVIERLEQRLAWRTR